MRTTFVLKYLFATLCHVRLLLQSPLRHREASRVHFPESSRLCSSKLQLAKERHTCMQFGKQKRRSHYSPEAAPAWPGSIGSQGRRCLPRDTEVCSSLQWALENLLLQCWRQSSVAASLILPFQQLHKPLFSLQNALYSNYREDLLFSLPNLSEK